MSLTKFCARRDKKEKNQNAMGRCTVFLDPRLQLHADFVFLFLSLHKSVFSLKFCKDIDRCITYPSILFMKFFMHFFMYLLTEASNSMEAHDIFSKGVLYLDAEM